MVVGDQACVMLLAESRFADVATKPVGDPREPAQAILAVSAQDRAGVDALADAALGTGATPARRREGLVRVALVAALPREGLTAVRGGHPVRSARPRWAHVLVSALHSRSP